MSMKAALGNAFMLIICLLFHPTLQAAPVVWVVAQIDDELGVEMDLLDDPSQEIESSLARSGYRVIQGSISQFDNKNALLSESKNLQAFFGQHYVIAIEPRIETQTSGDVAIQLTATVYASATNEVITAWSSIRKRVSLMDPCKGPCMDRLLAPHFTDLSYELQAALPTLIGQDRNGSKVNSSEKIYDVALVDLSPNEQKLIIDIMENEFPNFQSMSNTRIHGNLVTYQYISYAQQHELLDWLSVALDSIGLRVNQDVQLTLDHDQIRIKKLILRNLKRLNTSPLFN